VTVASNEPKKLGLVQAVNAALGDAMAADERVFLMGEDITDHQMGGVFRATAGLSTKFGSARVRSTPISEEGFVGAAVGAAVAGLIPVVEVMFMSFMTLALDQIHNHAAKMRYMTDGRLTAPLTVRMVAGAGSGTGPHHPELNEAWFAHSPGVKVVMPSTPADAYGLLTASIWDPDPTIFIEHAMLMRRSSKSPAPAPGYSIPLGKAHVEREGSDVTIIGYGGQLIDARSIADDLAQEGVSAEIVDLRTIAPLDADTILNSVAKTRRAVVVHEARKDFGVGAEVSARIHEELFGELRGPVLRVGGPFTPVPSAKNIETAWIVGREQLEPVVRQVLEY
jgi:acetoin:2,6-dichlorophenolindophenol oxidoreductase subunit beta